MKIKETGGSPDQWAIDTLNALFPAEETCSRCKTTFVIESVFDVHTIRWSEYDGGTVIVICPHCHTDIWLHGMKWDKALNAIELFRPKSKNPIKRFFESIPMG